jgi:hypothetical protein
VQAGEAVAGCQEGWMLDQGECIRQTRAQPGLTYAGG